MARKLVTSSITVKAIFQENVDLIKGYIQAIKAAETNPQLKSAYSGL